MVRLLTTCALAAALNSHSPQTKLSACSLVTLPGSPRVQWSLSVSSRMVMVTRAPRCAYDRVRTSLDRHRHLHRRRSSPVVPSRRLIRPAANRPGG